MLKLSHTSISAFTNQILVLTRLQYVNMQAYVKSTLEEHDKSIQSGLEM